MGMFKKATAKTTVMTPIQINGITVTNVEEAVSQINEQLSNISLNGGNAGGTGSGGSTTTNNLPYELGNYSTTYTLNPSQKISQEVYTGDVNRTRTVEYVPTGQAGSGKIKREIIIENGKTITISYSYDAYGNLNGKNVTTTTN